MFIGARANCMSVFVWVQIYYTVCGTAQFDGSIQLMLNSKWINTLLEKTVLQATAHLCWINHSKIFILTRSQATTPFTINTAMKSVALNEIPNFSVTLKHTNTQTPTPTHTFIIIWLNQDSFPSSFLFVFPYHLSQTQSLSLSTPFFF